MLEQQDDSAGQPERSEPGDRSAARAVRPLYTRTMPGGGCVRVELLMSDRGDIGGERRRGRVIIEPRDTAPRRAGEAPLVVEELEGDDEDAVVAELFRIARDNAALARRVLRSRAMVRRAD